MVIKGKNSKSIIHRPRSWSTSSSSSSSSGSKSIMMVWPTSSDSWHLEHHLPSHCVIHGFSHWYNGHWLTEDGECHASRVIPCNVWVPKWFRIPFLLKDKENIKRVQDSLLLHNHSKMGTYSPQTDIANFILCLQNHLLAKWIHNNSYFNSFKGRRSSYLRCFLPNFTPPKAEALVPK